jgi:hypothetical protein
MVRFTLLPFSFWSFCLLAFCSPCSPSRGEHLSALWSAAELHVAQKPSVGAFEGPSRVALISTLEAFVLTGHSPIDVLRAL